jgi:hypothetical protein
MSFFNSFRYVLCFATSVGGQTTAILLTVSYIISALLDLWRLSVSLNGQISGFLRSILLEYPPWVKAASTIS